MEPSSGRRLALSMPYALLLGTRNHALNQGANSATVIQDGDRLVDKKRIREHVQAEACFVRCARDFQRRYMAAKRAGCSKSLSWRFLAASIRNETGWCEANELFAGGSKVPVERIDREAQDTRKLASKRENQVWISRRSVQLSVGRRKECLNF